MAKQIPRKLNIEIQERDLLILRDLFESRVMALSHVSELHFEGREDAAKKRIQKLKAAGFISERPRQSFGPSILHLARKAFTLLSHNGILNEYPQFSLNALEKRSQVSRLTLEHELSVMEVKAAVSSALRTAGSFRIAEFSTWPLLSQFEAYRQDRMRVTMKPDGFIRIHEQQEDGSKLEHVFFLEVDRSTEKQDVLAQKAACYVDYYKRGGFAVRNGATAESFKDFPFRVLIVCKTKERRNNAAERLLQNNPPILRMVWLSTFEEFLSDPLGSIWIRPLDYRETTQETVFDVNHRRQHFGYRRQGEREAHIEKSIKKLCLLAETSGQ